MTIEERVAMQLGDLLLKNLSLQVEIDELKAMLEKQQLPEESVE